MINQLGTEEKEAYVADKANYGTIAHTEKLLPSNAQVVPIVLGHKYKIHFGLTGLDWDQMGIEISERWREDDPSIYFVHNFTDIRAEIDVNLNGGELIPNLTIGPVAADW